jgi:uncharacterized surface protein with fasciclin (FAS1) repeats
MAADVTKIPCAKTVEGRSLAIKSRGGKVSINTATVTKTDIGAFSDPETRNNTRRV